MSEHLRELLSRFVAGDVDRDEADHVRSHLEACESCRRDAELHRRLEQMLSSPTALSTSARSVHDEAAATARRMRLQAWSFAGLAVVQLAAGIWVVAHFGRSHPLIAGLVAGILMADCGLMFAIAVLIRSNRRELHRALEDWHKLRRFWEDALERRVRNVRIGVLSAAMLLAVGALFVLRFALGHGALWGVIGIANLAIGIANCIVFPLDGRRAARQLSRLRQLA